MKPTRQQNHKPTLFISFALLAMAAASIAYWLLSQLDQISALAGSAALPGSRASADYASVRLFVWVALSADLGAAGLLALWLRAELSRPSEPVASISDAELALCLDERSTADIDATDEAHQAALASRMQDMTEALVALMLKVRSSPAPLDSASASRRTGQERRRAAPAIHLISNNPNPVPSHGNERRAPTPMLAVHSSSGRAAMPVHAWAAARQDISWEES